VTPQDINDALYQASIASCSLDISRTLKSVGAAATYLSLTALHCTGHLNLKAVCSAGITGLAAALAGVASSGSGIFLACDFGQRTSDYTARSKAAATTALSAQGQPIINQACTPDTQELPYACFAAWGAFFSPCPGSTGVTASCPQAPTVADGCPGATELAACATELSNNRNAFIASGNAWPPNPLSPVFVTYVAAINSCFEYLDCFLPGTAFSPTRRLSEEQGEGIKADADGEAEETTFELPRISLENLSAEKDPQFPELPPANAKVVRAFREQMLNARDRGLKQAEASGRGFQGFDLDTRLWDSIGHNLTALTEKVNLNDPYLESERGHKDALRLLKEASERLAAQQRSARSESVSR